jgi:hypothetical protein
MLRPRPTWRSPGTCSARGRAPSTCPRRRSRSRGTGRRRACRRRRRPRPPAPARPAPRPSRRRARLRRRLRRLSLWTIPCRRLRAYRYVARSTRRGRGARCRRNNAKRIKGRRKSTKALGHGAHEPRQHAAGLLSRSSGRRAALGRWRSLAPRRGRRRAPHHAASSSAASATHVVFSCVEHGRRECSAARRVPQRDDALSDERRAPRGVGDRTSVMRERFGVGYLERLARARRAS